ncbi:MAG: 23S rRNA (uracil(1939)-C(5))-methyltransferase RlmD [Sutterellaceae bacterium]|nr:23S rRNA (uracil(1939)-C(5))-methyltransferase RlmD [Burkholderiaceae bacterium]MCX7901319.1 23S rRNA (uracil(1939)-C(5))-methyltransferase RlmD [Burkholderiaceae bacterium]MDW8429056.1 23S rRNA (uracil(1939)-C(5))-methyltransferase RlmD [Sutterellaceae bacterium]
MSEEVIEVEIESLDLEGRGVARRDGKVLFVAGALPGERVRAVLQRRKTSYDSARLLQVLRASSQRVPPRCPHFGLHTGACGGCSMQHVEARAQLAIKQRALEDALWHLARLRPARLLRAIAGPAWHYRQRARLSVRDVPKKGGVLVGFHERASSYVADMRVCHVLPRAIGDLLPALRTLIAGLSIRARLPQIELAASQEGAAMRYALVLRVLQPPTPEDVQRLLAFEHHHGVEFWLQPGGPQTATPLAPGRRRTLALTLREPAVTLAFAPTDFTQVNHAVNEVLVRRALQLLAPQAQETVIDFFCGLGNFTLPVAQHAAVVIGIEGNAALVERARQAAAANGLAQRVRFLVRDLFQWTVADWDELSVDVDAVLLDPPREGALAVARSLVPPRKRPQRIVYISCNPATLARDCAVLCHEGGWVLQAAGIVDMFPHTAHVESVALLTRGQTAA